MKAAHSRAGLLSLDILALSLMCCLLASVVGVLVLGGEEAARAAAENQQEGVRIWSDFRHETARLSVQVGEVERSREDIVNKLNQSLLERENLDLESRAQDIQQRIGLINRIQAAKAETARLTKELEDEAKTRHPVLTPEAKRMLGEYKGPYVLLECVEDGAVVYPGKVRVSMKPSKEEAAKLLSQIIKAGFVAFVVRPAGWYGNSYDKLRTLIYEELDKTEKETGKYVGRSTFPLDSGISITNYLPAESKP